MEFEKAKAYILDRIRRELPDNLFYHSYDHTRDVLQATQMISKAEGITGEDLILLCTAALFHDSGFVIQYNDHEIYSCQIVREVLPELGYSDKQIEQVCDMIMSTKIPQSPKNHLSKIICDADLDYLGRDDFWTIGNNLYQELAARGILKSEEDWNRIQVGFLGKHSYFTETSRNMRAPKKETHLNRVKHIVSAYS